MAEDAGDQRRFGSTLFWQLFALVNLISVAWVVWLIWQLTPRPVVNDFVLRMPLPASQLQRTGAGSVPAASATAGTEPAPAAASVAPAPELPIHSGAPMTPLRLDTEIRTPPKAAGPAAKGN